MPCTIQLHVNTSFGLYYNALDLQYLLTWDEWLNEEMWNEQKTDLINKLPHRLLGMCELVVEFMHEEIQEKDENCHDRICIFWINLHNIG